jgi:hypothetical protein
VTKTSAENVKPVSAIGAAGLSLAALGVVFGDIGTSPLYTLKTVLNLTGASPDAATTLGALSLILWTLFIVTTVKYVNFAMRIDNDGEGGIIALLALLRVKKQQRRSTSSEALRPCLKANRTMVESRMARAVVLRRLNQPLDLSLGQVLAGPIGSVGLTGKATVRFTLAGPTAFRCRPAAIFRPSMRYTAHSLHSELGRTQVSSRAAL